MTEVVAPFQADVGSGRGVLDRLPGRLAVLPQEAELLLHHLGPLLAGLFEDEIGSGRESARLLEAR